MTQPSPLPTGTLTFLFTDIEGSTARWEHQREAMAGNEARPLRNDLNSGRLGMGHSQYPTPNSQTE